MLSPMHSEQSIRFGEFELHPRTRELQRNGDRSLMQEQPFQVLLMLLERPGDLVTREELTKRLWPAETFVDFEHSLNKAVKRLREVLGDSAESPRFIETLPRQGYRFIGPVEHVASGSLVESRGGTSELEAVPANSFESARRLAALAACVVLLAAATATYYFATRSKASAAPAKVTQISQWNKPMGRVRLSPEGHSVVFDSPVGGVHQLFVMLTSGGEPLQVTSDAGNKFPLSFSPDGTEIYFEKDPEMELWRVPTLGGSPRRVVSGYQVVPSSDGTYIFYCKVDKPGIFRADKSGLNEEMIYKPDGTSLYPLLTFPGGDDLLVAGYKGHAIDFHLFRLNLTSRESVDLGEVASGNPDVAWAEPGSSLLLGRTVNGLTNIWKYDLRNRGFTQITFGPGEDYYPMPDPGGKGIYFVNAKFSGVLTAYSVQSKESREIVAEAVDQPIISPDGKRVMYLIRSDERRTSLWVADTDGKNKLKIASAEDLATGTWAPDSTSLSYFETGSSTEAKAYIVRADGSGLRQIPGIGHTLTLNPVWSPNQKSVYLSALENLETLPSVWKWGLDRSRPQELVDKCGVVYDVDPGEQYLLAATIGAWSGIYEVSISDGKCVSLIPGVKTDRLRFARDGKSILYATISGGETLIFRQGWNDGKLIGTPQVALKVPFSLYFYSYDFSRDLSTIVYARPGGNADLYLLSKK